MVATGPDPYQAGEQAVLGVDGDQVGRRIEVRVVEGDVLELARVVQPAVGAGHLVAEAVVEETELDLIRLRRGQQRQAGGNRGVHQAGSDRVGREHELDLVTLRQEAEPAPQLERLVVGAADPGVQVVTQVGDHRVHEWFGVLGTPGIDRDEPAAIGPADGRCGGHRDAVADEAPARVPGAPRDHALVRCRHAAPPCTMASRRAGGGCRPVQGAVLVLSQICWLACLSRPGPPVGPTHRDRDRSHQEGRRRS